MYLKIFVSTLFKKQSDRDPRHRRFKTISTALTIVVIVGVILLNVIVSVLADNYPLTIDMSSSKVFTLSEDSKNFAKSITDEVEVILFADPQEYFEAFTQYLHDRYQLNYELQLDRIGREVSTALAQLKSHSGGKITYSFVDPDQEPEKFAKYAEYDLKDDENILFISGERYKKDSLRNMAEPDLVTTNTVNSNVEQVLISNISALQGDNERIIQVLTGHNEDQATIAGLKVLYELNGYIFEDLAITGSTEFNEKAEVLLIAAPTTDYTEDEIHRIETWMNNDNKRNRHLMVFIHPTADCPNLYGLLEDEYEITVTDELIYDENSDRHFSDGTGKPNPAYTWADIGYNPYTSTIYDLGAVKTPQARRLSCSLPTSATQGIEELGLQLTSHPDTATIATIGSDGDREKLKDTEYPLVSGISYVFEAHDDNEQKAATTTVSVFGSSAMAYTTYTQDPSAYNAELLLCVIQSVTDYQTEVTVANKVVTNDVTQFTTRTAMVLGIWIFTIGLPAAILVLCLVVFIRRRTL